MLWRHLIAMGLFAFALPAQPPQSRDIFQRLREAPLPAGQGDLLAKAFRLRDFSVLERELVKAKATTAMDRAELLCLLGGVEFVAEKMDASAAAYLAAEKLIPLNDGDSFTLAMAQIKLQQGAAAGARLSALAARSPEQPLYLYWLGKLDYDERRYDEAIVKLRRVIELDPQSVRAYNSLGLAFDMQGRFAPAQEALEKAANLNRQQTRPSPWPPHDLGYLLFRMNRFEEARDALRESLQYDPDFAQAHYHLGRVLEKEGDESEAIGEYEKAIALDKASAEPCYSLGLLYRKIHREADAERMFSEFRRRKKEH
jgi:tetratricopeptide (TPR) repeat protein